MSVIDLVFLLCLYFSDVPVAYDDGSNRKDVKVMTNVQTHLQDKNIQWTGTLHNKTNSTQNIASCKMRAHEVAGMEAEEKFRSRCGFQPAMQSRYHMKWQSDQPQRANSRLANALV